MSGIRVRKQYDTFPKLEFQPSINTKVGDEEKKDGDGLSDDTKIKLKREIGLLEGTSITLGAIIGSGIFISPKGIVDSVRSVGLSLIIWIASGVLSTIGAICYTELGTSFPSSGGDYHYINEAFGALPAFLFIWSSMMIFVPCNNAILALSFGQYVMQPLFSQDCSITMPDSGLRLLAAAAICLLTFISCFDPNGSAKAQNVFGFIKLAALGLIIVTGIVRLINGHNENFTNAFANSNTDPGSIALAFYSGIYAFGGANTLNAMTEEVKDPNRNLPRSIYFAMAIVIVVYLLTNAAYFTAMSPQEMLDSDAVAVTFGDKTLGAVSWLISACVAISTFGGLGVNIMMSSRVLFAGARNGHFPLMLSHIQYERRTPIPSLIFLCILSLIYLSTSDVFGLINYAGFMYSIISVGAGAALIFMRWKLPHHPRPVKVHLIYPILYFLLSLFLFVLPIYVAPLEAGIGCAITLSGLPIYYIIVKPKEQPVWLSNFLDKATRMVQKLFLSLPTDEDEK